MRVSPAPLDEGEVQRAFGSWCAVQHPRLDPQATSLSEWVMAHAATVAAAAFAKPLNGVYHLPLELPAAPPSLSSLPGRHFRSLWHESSWRVAEFASGQPPWTHKVAVMLQAWRLQAVLDFQYTQRARASLYDQDVGPWKLVRVLDPHGDTGTVLKAVRRSGACVQERAVMLLPKPAPAEASQQGAARKLTEAEVRSLERATLLGALSAPSLPAVESAYCVTPDRALGWRFMELLGDDVTTMERGFEHAADDSVPKRCYRAIKLGLKLLAALRPLHARGLVHAALAPKHIARISAGRHGEYKL